MLHIELYGEQVDTISPILQNIGNQTLQTINYTKKASVEVMIITNDEIKSLNQQYRQIDKATDTLSFPLEHFECDGMIHLGSIAISIEMAQLEADRLSHSLEDEISILFIHSLLHLMGFDHENDDGKHRQIESQIAKLCNLPYALIERNMS